MERTRTTQGPGVRPLTRPILRFDLADESAALRLDESWREHGHSAKSLVKHRDLTIVMIAMKRDAHIKEHQTDGAVSIHVLSGRIVIHADDRTIEASTASLVALDRDVAHDVEALEDSTFLLSVARPHAPA